MSLQNRYAAVRPDNPAYDVMLDFPDETGLPLPSKTQGNACAYATDPALDQISWQSREMPQQRQRIVFCDCLDCVQQPPTTDIQSSTSPANEAAARQEPPPKCLMFVLSGVLLPKPAAQNPATATVLDSCNLPHLNRATAQGNLCLLTLRQDAAAGVYLGVVSSTLLGVTRQLH